MERLRMITEKLMSNLEKRTQYFTSRFQYCFPDWRALGRMFMSPAHTASMIPMRRELGQRRRMVVQEEGEERMAREETKEVIRCNPPKVEMGRERTKVGLNVNHQAGHEGAQGRTRGT